MGDSTGTTTYAYNAGNRLTLLTDPSSNLTTNTYDNNGNLTVTNWPAPINGTTCYVSPRARSHQLLNGSSSRECFRV